MLYDKTNTALIKLKVKLLSATTNAIATNIVYKIEHESHEFSALLESHIRKALTILKKK